MLCPDCAGRGRRYEPRPLTARECLGPFTGPVPQTETKFEVMCETCKGSGEITLARLPVMQDGHQVGTLPSTFDPFAIRSRSPFYQPRQGDFRRDGDAWVAHPSLGPGDLGAVPGFVFSY